MKKLLTSSPINPKQLSPSQLEALSDAMYKVHLEIFDGVSKSAFHNYVVCPDAVLTRIFLFRNQLNEVVGYQAFHVYQIEVSLRNRLKKVYVFRAENGVLQAYRGRTPIYSTVLKEVLQFMIRRGFPRAYFFAAPIHPTPYCLIHRSTHTLYPRPGIPTPKKISDIMEGIAKSFKMEQSHSDGNFVKHIGWIVRNCERKHRALLRSSAPDVRFFLEENPNYREGHGLMILAPANISNAVKTLIKRNRSAKRKRAGLLQRIKSSFQLPRLSLPSSSS